MRIQDFENLVFTKILPDVNVHWDLETIGDIDGNGTDDIVWRAKTGRVHYWSMENGKRVKGADVIDDVSKGWKVVGSGDISGDGTDDIVWQYRTGHLYYWKMANGLRASSHRIPEGDSVSENWTPIGVGNVD